MPPSKDSGPEHPRSPFPVTSWTLIRKVQKGTDAEAAKAMEEICRAYWYAIYAYARRYGFSAHDAEDLTQVFFRDLITYEGIQAARQEKGRLRTFMLTMLKRIISKHLRHDAAAKRGGGKGATVSLEECDAEDRYLREPVDSHDPEALFDRAWAEGILRAAEARLLAEYVEADNLETYQQIREFLPMGDNSTPYATAAARLNTPEPTLRLKIHRMRKRYAKLIEKEIAETVTGGAEVREELEHLMTVMGR